MRVHNKVRDYYVAEVEHLLQCGEGYQAICDHLGVTASALSRALYRERRPELARLFGGMRPPRNARPRTCADCPARISDKATRCQGCEQARRRAMRAA